MEYNDLQTKVKQSINGQIAQYMDVYIRKNKVWTPKQMCFDFLAVKTEEYSTVSLYFRSDPERRDIIISAISWILSKKGQELVLARMEIKFNKDKDIAIRENPIVERVRFGQRPDNIFDINFGLKGTRGFDRTSTEELRAIKYIAWSNKHVADQLNEKYDKDLKKIHLDLPFNNFEIDFSEYWFNNFFSINKPALIPHIIGLRSIFGYIEYKGHIYKNYQDIEEDYNVHNVKFTRFKYDFMLVDTPKLKSCFIDIISDDLHDNQKSTLIVKEKKRQALESNFDYITIKQSEIKISLKKCFSQLKQYL